MALEPDTILLLVCIVLVATYVDKATKSIEKIVVRCVHNDASKQAGRLPKQSERSSPERSKSFVFFFFSENDLNSL